VLAAGLEGARLGGVGVSFARFGIRNGGRAVDAMLPVVVAGLGGAMGAESRVTAMFGTKIIGEMRIRRNVGAVLQFRVNSGRVF